MASTYLTRTPSVAGNRRTFTVSFWAKRTGLDIRNYVFDAYNGSSQAENQISFNSNTIHFTVWNNSTSSVEAQIVTNRLFRDTSAWYHIVVAVDTTQTTASDRIKLYVNGVQETSFSSTTYPSQNYETGINTTSPHSIGRWEGGTSRYFDGSLAHFHFIDGTAYDASAFGETDSTTGIWKAKTAPSVTYGTNGFFLKFENSGAFGTDSSGNGNTFTVNGTMTQTIDTPSNVFATLNALNKVPSDTTFSNGNTSIAQLGGDGGNINSTLGVSAGKYYWEAKVLNWSSDARHGIGIGTGSNSYNSRFWKETNGIGLVGHLNPVIVIQNDSTVATLTGITITTNDILSFALDKDNNKFYIGKNGTWLNSGDPTSGATGTGAIGTVSSTETYFASTTANNTDGNNIHTNDWNFNFGNGYFGTAQVASAENPDDGIGIFEYSVPTGYRALCTKSINAEEYS